MNMTIRTHTRGGDSRSPWRVLMVFWLVIFAPWASGSRVAQASRLWACEPDPGHRRDACATLSALPCTDTIPKPQRLVSICVQGDQLLVQLVPRERIAAVSALAADPDISPQWEKARGIPVTKGSAEELVKLKPDLVLAGAYTTRVTVAALKQLGVRVLELGVANDFDELRAQIRQVAQSLGEEARGEELVSAMDTRLARLSVGRPPISTRPTALFYFQDGFVPGAHTFANAILEAAGFRNLGGTFSLGVGASASTETVIMARPQYLILARYLEANPTLTQVSQTQPLFAKLSKETAVLSVSFRHLACPDASNLDLAEYLHQKLTAQLAKEGLR